MARPTGLALSTVLLGVFCLFSGFLVAYELLSSPPPRPVSTPGPVKDAVQPPRVEDEFSLPAPSHYAVVTERPLFLKSRQPAPQDAAKTDEPSATEGQLSQYALTAVVIAPEQQFAILRAQAEGKLSRVTSGQEFQGWTLKQVEGDGVVFGRSDKEERLPLVRKTPDKIRQAARRAELLERRRQQLKPQQPPPAQPAQPQAQAQPQAPAQPQQPAPIPPPGEAPPLPATPPE